jgi:hypothetical protein
VCGPSQSDAWRGEYVTGDHRPPPYKITASGSIAKVTKVTKTTKKSQKHRNPKIVFVTVVSFVAIVFAPKAP